MEEGSRKKSINESHLNQMKDKIKQMEAHIMFNHFETDFHFSL